MATTGASPHVLGVPSVVDLDRAVVPDVRATAVRGGARDAALRLSKALGVDDRFWINIQTDYDLEIERDLHDDELDKVTTLVVS